MKRSPYNHTTDKAIMEVVRVDQKYIGVITLKHEAPGHKVGEKYDDLLPEYFSLLKGAKKRLKNEWKEDLKELMGQPFSFTASYIAINKNGTTESFPEAQCHSGLSRINVGCKFVISRIDKKALTVESKAFYNWLIKKSVYAPFITNRGATDAFREGLRMRTDVPSNMLAQALIISRHPWEFPETVRLWWLLVKAGINKDMAFAFTSLICNENKGWVYFVSAGNHRAINGEHLSASFFKSYLSSKPANPNPNFYDNPQYQGVFNLWGRNSRNNLVLSKLKTDKVHEWMGWSGTINRDHYCSTASMLRQMVKLANEIEEEIRE